MKCKKNNVNRYHKVMFSLSIGMMILFIGILIFSSYFGSELTQKSSNNGISLKSISIYQSEYLAYALR
jgi:hypothetical protein